MGEVWKAEDTQLRRTVALKFLSSATVGDDEVKARLIREAQASASLDHPNICQVFGIHEEQGETFIAMAYIDGPPLADKIKERPLPVEEALDLAIQIGGGLQEAHEKGIVHRDIKPQNIILTAKGQVKIMDFGLASLTGRSKLTKTGTTLGTPAYMAPEQLEGRQVDRRADIWALGCVLYEMLTQQTPFEAEYEQAIGYGILNEDPEPVTALRGGLPSRVDGFLAKALAKDKEERYQHVDEMLVDLRGLTKKLTPEKSASLSRPAAASSQSSPKVGPAQALAPQQPTAPAVSSEELVPKRKLRLAWAVAAVAALVALGVSLLYFRQTATEAPLRRFTFTPSEAVAAPATFHSNVAISPNGKHIAFTTAGSEGKLWVQDLDQRRPRAIGGTEGAINPFWSPESDFIGFGAAGELKKVSVQGGLAIRLCELSSTLYGASWSPDGEVIVFSSGLKLYEVPSRGGTSNLLILREESEGSPRGPTGGKVFPRFLPSEAGARVLVFTIGSSTAQTMMVQNLETGQRELLGPGATPFYSPSGHLVHQTGPQAHDLWALPFSLDTLTATGDAFPISENSRGPTVAADGTLVYLDGIGSGRQQLVWLDRSGEKTGEIGQAHEVIGSSALSPDGRLVAVEATEDSNEDVWVYDIARGVRIRMTSAPESDRRPVWSPAGDELAFTSNRVGNRDIFLRQADGTGERKVLAATPHTELLCDWSRDGKYLLYSLNDPETGNDLWRLERNEDGSAWEPHPFLQTPFSEHSAKFSPDHRYVAYVSNESGQDEVYVQPFPEGGRKVTVSNNGGKSVRWSQDGRELFYVEGEAFAGETLVAVSVSSGSSFSVGSTTRLFKHPGLRPGLSYPYYDVSADGQRFILAEPVGAGPDAPEPSIRVVQNWYEEFRGRKPN